MWASSYGPRQGRRIRYLVATPDRDCNEVKYLQEALDMIEDFQRRDTRREAAEITLAERPR